MAAYDFTAPRLFVEAALQPGEPVELDRARAHYLLNVMRLKAGDDVLAFNGRDGEWRCAIDPSGRKSAEIRPLAQTRPQPPLPALDYLFAPLKHARLDYMAQKAVEMGAGRLMPVITRRTVATRVNLERLSANAIEAAEQCGILAVPEIVPEAPLAAALAALPADRLVVFCDEEAEIASPLRALQARPAPGEAGLAVLIGPEGGFDEQERAAILSRSHVLRLSLGPRILRADTAAVAALAVVQAVLGDWR